MNLEETEQSSKDNAEYKFIREHCQYVYFVYICIMKYSITAVI